MVSTPGPNISGSGSRRRRDRRAGVPVHEQRRMLARLLPLLGNYGLRAELVKSEAYGVLLNVINPAGPSTSVFVTEQPGFDELAVYGFSNLYLGLVAEPDRVAARLAWLLGVADASSPERSEIKKTGEMHQTKSVQGKSQQFPSLLTPSEVAKLFRVDPKTVSRWAESGRLPSIRTLGGHRRYRSADVLPYLQPCTTGSGTGEVGNGNGAYRL